MDSGSQPEPHYCEHPAATRREGCPDWPACLPLPYHVEPSDDSPGLAESLASLAAFAGWCVIFLIIVAILLPFMI